MVLWRYVSRYQHVSRYLQLVGVDPPDRRDDVDNPHVMPEVVEDLDRSQDTTSEGTEDQDTTTSSDPYLDISQSERSSVGGGLRRRETTLSEELAANSNVTVTELESNVDDNNAEYYL